MPGGVILCDVGLCRCVPVVCMTFNLALNARCSEKEASVSPKTMHMYANSRPYMPLTFELFLGLLHAMLKVTYLCCAGLRYLLQLLLQALLTPSPLLLHLSAAREYATMLSMIHKFVKHSIFFGQGT